MTRRRSGSPTWASRGAASSISARSAADLVLAEPDLPRMHDALVESRAMWHRMQQAVSVLVGGNAGEVGFMMLGTATGADQHPPDARREPAHRHVPRSGGGPGGRSRPRGDEPGRLSALGASPARTVAVHGDHRRWAPPSPGRSAGTPVGVGADSMGLVALVGTQLGQTLLTGWRSPLVVATTLSVLRRVPRHRRDAGRQPAVRVYADRWTIALAASLAGTPVAAAAQRRFAIA